MNSENKENTANNERSGNSSIEFPYSDLESSWALAMAVYTIGGSSCEDNQLAAHLKMEPKGGGFRLRIGGARLFDLISTERGGKIYLTDLGKKAVDNKYEKIVKAEAFLRVPLYKKFYDEYKGRPLPNPLALEQILKNYGVGEKVADRARQVMLRAAKQAGYFDLSGDRLTKPPTITEYEVSENEQETDSVVSERFDTAKNNFGKAESLSPQLHPLIQGLLLTLPDRDSEWSVVKRKDWLVMANSIFKMIYPSQEYGEVEITLNSNP